MIPDAASVNEIVQHALVSVVALGAVGVVLRRVVGVFETRPANPSAPGTGPGSESRPYRLGGAQEPSPACSHCAAGTAAQRKVPHQ